MKRTRQIHNRAATNDLRRSLRSHLTPAEATLWINLKEARLEGMKFRRQHNIGPFVLDFYCPECRLAIELDGAGHHTEIGAERDHHRTQYLERHKVRVLRFENKLIWENLEAVLEAIREAVREVKAGEGK